MKLPALVALLALVACGGRSSRDVAPDGEAGALRVGLITPGSITDAAWNSGAYRGLEEVRDSLGAKVSHVEARTPASQEEALRAYAAQGYQLVFAHGYEFQQAAEQVSREFPATAFVVTSGSRAAERVAPLIFRLEEASYLAGMVAGALTRTGKIGFVGGVELPPVTGAAVGWILLWFLLGYGFYGLLYAAAGSLAADSQEAANVIGPLSVVLVVGYMAAWTSLPMQGETVVIRVLSWIPLWSPIVMPTRIVRGWAPGWEVAAIVLLMLVAIYGMLRLAGRIYVGGVARSSSTLGWREAFRQGRDLQTVSR